MSDPGQLAKKLLQKYLPKAGSIRKDVTYQSMGAPTYTVATGAVVDVVVVALPLKVIWSDFNFTKTSAQETKVDDSTILSIDRLIIYPALDLPVVAKAGDRVVELSGKTWTVQGVALDPADAHFELHVRPWAE